MINARDSRRSTKLSRIWRRLDFVLLVLTILLIFIGIVFIYGAGRQIGGSFSSYWIRQIIYVILGIPVFIGLVAIDYRRLGKFSWCIYLLSGVALVYVLFFGRTINNASRWISLFDFTIQPAELAKPAAILFLAWLASRPWLRFKNFGGLFIFALTIAPIPFLIALQPDLGTATVFIAIGGAITFSACISWRWIIYIALAVTLLLPVVYHTGLEKYQQERLLNLIQPSRDVSASGWNAHQALLAVGSGGFFGKGYMRGTQHVLGYLPRNVAPTDFIFSVIGEETGFLGAGTLVCAYIGILVCCLRAAARAPDSFGAYICVGTAAMFFIHTYINIGMSIYMAPIVGLPLPLISYGGSFIMSMLISLGLVQSVYVRRDTAPPKEREKII